MLDLFGKPSASVVVEICLKRYREIDIPEIRYSLAALEQDGPIEIRLDRDLHRPSAIFGLPLATIWPATWVQDVSAPNAKSSGLGAESVPPKARRPSAAKDSGPPAIATVCLTPSPLPRSAKGTRVLSVMARSFGFTRLAA
jgi:hypothetical protein